MTRTLGFGGKEKLGAYTVKSAYVIMQDYPNPSEDSGFWRKIWHLKIPQKTKIFMWRALSDCLPTKEQLRMKKVQVNPICSVCNESQEMVIHILVSCPFAKLCWEQMGHEIGSGTDITLEQWMTDVQQRHNREEVEMITMICWGLWKNRNEIIWNQNSMEVLEVVESAKLILSQWKSAQTKSFDNFLGFMTQADGKTHWERPQNGMVKINTDAAVFESSNCYSYSMVVRSHTGELVEAKSCCKQGNVDPEMAEVIGIREALSWVKEKQMSNVVIETDCLAWSKPFAVLSSTFHTWEV